MLNYEGRVALITGAGRGLGRAHALTLGQRGCRVVVNDLPGGDTAADDVVAEIVEAGGEAVISKRNVLTEANEMINDACHAYGGLDIVINNAGYVDHRNFDVHPADEWQQAVDVHLAGAVEVCRAAWPLLKKSGTGRVINTISGSIVGAPGQSSYMTAKGGVLGFSRSIGFEGLEYGINVNCISPHAFTRLQEGTHPKLYELLKANFQVERVAAFVAWLTHQDSTIANEIFHVGGGRVARMTYAMYPYVQASADTPEAWSQLVADVTSSDGDLTAISKAVEIGIADMRHVDPSFTIDGDSVLGNEE